jgi:hypothetical protein
MTGCGVSLEKAKYSVIAKAGKFEVRLYEPQVVAETLVESDFGEAGNIAFERLYGYISGQNRSKEAIAMTAPVSQEKASEKIAMTAPVNLRKAGRKWAVNFLLPAKYTMATAPEPLSELVTLREVPARKIAAVRYSGSWSRKRYEDHKARLEQFIEDNELRIVDEPIFARYDPPFQLPFLRRNEVLIPVD